MGKAVAELNLKGGAEGRYWLASMIGHVVLIGLVIWLTPVREMIFEKEKPTEAPVKTRGEELDEVMEEVRVQIADQIRERVNLLNEGQTRMAGNYETFQKHYLPFVEDQLESALNRFESHATRALEGLAALEDHLKRALEEKVYSGLIEDGSALQSRIATSQREIRRGMVLLEADEDILSEQVVVEEAQWEMGPRLREVQSDVGWITVSAPKRMTDLREELAERERALEKEESILAKRREALEKILAEQQAAREGLEEAEAVLADEDADPEARKEAEERKVKFEPYLGNQRQRKQEVSQAENTVGNALKAVGNREKARREVAQNLEKLTEEMEKRRDRLDTTLAEVISDQTRLHVLQRELIENVRALALEQTSKESSS
jgi:hypothetical protein